MANDLRVHYMVSIQGPWNENPIVTSFELNSLEDEKNMRRAFARSKRTNDFVVIFAVAVKRIPNSRIRVPHHEGVVWNPLCEWFAGVVLRKLYLEATIHSIHRDDAHSRLKYAIDAVIEAHYTEETCN